MAVDVPVLQLHCTVVLVNADYDFRGIRVSAIAL